MLVIAYAKKCLAKIFRRGYKYKKVGIMLLDLVDNSYSQYSLLSNENTEKKSSQVMETIDNINQRMGKHTVFLTSQEISRNWQTKASQKSPNYIGDWSQLIGAS